MGSWEPATNGFVGVSISNHNQGKSDAADASSMIHPGDPPFSKQNPYIYCIVTLFLNCYADETTTIIALSTSYGCLFVESSGISDGRRSECGDMVPLPSMIHDSPGFV